MSDHIEEISCLNALLTIIAARIEALKLKHQNEAIKAQMAELNNQLANQAQQLKSLKEANK